MKKLMVCFLAVLLVCTCGITAFAAGVDDGTVSVVDKNGEKFFGTEIDQGLTKYVAANGSGESFYDANGDKEMDVCDLVAVVTGQLDLDQSGSYTNADTATLRLILIGANN
jgi:uncharacterized protein YxeA